MNDYQKPVIRQEYSVEKFDDEIVLYAESETRAVYLNDAAYAVWQLCKEDLSVGQIIDYLEKTYPDQQVQIRKDVLTALKMLESKNIIMLSDDK